MPLARSLSRLIGALLATPLLAAAPADPSPRPNFIVFLADDLGLMDLAFEDPGSFHETPRLDALAAEGARFTAAYAASPVCSPTRYSVLTGRYPTRSGLTDYLVNPRRERFAPAPLAPELPAAETTLAEALADAGYATAFVGKWHLGDPESAWPEHHGFAVNVGGFSKGTPPSFVSPYRNPRLADGPEGEHLEDRLADESIRLLEAFAAEGRPFLLCHWFYAPHNPVVPPADLLAKYQAKAAATALPADAFAELPQHHLSAKGPRRAKLVRNRPDYAAHVESLDRAAGRILDRLDALGLAGSTVVLFLSDNGGLSTAEGMPTSCEPLRAGKGWLHEGGIRIPFVVRWPGVARPGSTVDTPAMTIDILPTLLAAAWVEAPAGIDGTDLAPLLRGEPSPPRDLFWHYPHYSNQGGFPGGGLRAGHWKLLENLEDGSAMLFDLAADPSERSNLAADPLHAARLADLRARLHAWYAGTGARFLEPLPGGEAPWRP